MNKENLWNEYSRLPSDAQDQVADFIALLRRRYSSYTTNQQAEQTLLAKEPFIGIWQDREEMKDSSQWVRATRTREWS